MLIVGHDTASPNSRALVFLFGAVLDWHQAKDREEATTMKYWNVHDDELLRTLLLAGIPALSFERGKQGGVAIYWEKYFLGVWVEFQRERYDFVPAAFLEATHKACSAEQAIQVSRLLAAEAALVVPKARATPGRPPLEVA